MPRITGRRHIRNEPNTGIPGNPIFPVSGRPNTEIHFWEGETKPGSLLSKLETAYADSLASVDRVLGRRAEASKSGNFTPQGLTDEMRKASVGAVPQLKAARSVLARAKQEADTLRAKVKIPPVDKTDIAAAMLRREIREHIKSMPPEARDKYFARENLAPEVIAAVFEVSPDLVGNPSPTILGRLREQTLRAAHGEAMDELGELERGIEVAASAVNAAEEEIRAEAGAFDPMQWHELTKDIKPAAPVPWLRESGGKTIVLDMDTRTSRPATDEDLAEGRYFKDYEEFIATNGKPNYRGKNAA